MILSLDFETRSTVDLRRTSVYPYAEDPTTDIWLFAWAIDDAPPTLWHPGDPLPEEITDQVRDFEEIRGWNVAFERIIWWLILHRRYGFPRPEREQFVDTAAEAAAMALPRSLGQAARVLGLDVEKDAEGRRLMLQMAKPRKPRKDEDPDALLWWDTPEKIQRLGEYCIQDVLVERAIAERLRPLSAYERKVYLLDQEINDRGVQLDRELIEAAQEIVDEGTERANQELQDITDGAVSAVTNTAELRDFTGMDSVAKDKVREALEEGDLSSDHRRVLEIRQDAGKSSTAKLVSMQEYACSDWRARGMLLYHGADTGRWSGKGPQPQNYPRPEDLHFKWCAGQDPDADCDCGGIEGFIDLILNSNKDLDKLYDEIEANAPPLVVISSLLRSMLIAAPGHRLIAGDFSQIEARVLAWLFEQDDLVELFASGGKVYEEMAGEIYGIPVESIAKDSEERQVGKTTILGAGFQMGSVTFAEQTKKQTGIELSKEDAEKAIEAYRNKNDKIKQGWYDINDAAIAAVAEPGKVTSVGRGGMVRYVVRGQFLWCILPSGRPLAYALPRIVKHTVRPRDPEKDPFVTTAVRVMGMNGYTRRWEARHLYGGLLTENVVQGIARDLLAAAMLRVDDAGYRPVLTTHDEILCETPEGHGSLEDFLRTMTVKPQWAEHLPVAAEGFESVRYRK